MSLVVSVFHFVCTPDIICLVIAAVAQELQDQEEVGEENEAEQAHSLLDPHEDGQHHPLQRQEKALAPHQAWVLEIILFLMSFSQLFTELLV